MSNTEKRFTSKLGTSRAGERTRIWLEGNRLVAHGFAHQTPFKRAWSEGRLVITWCDLEDFRKLARDERGMVAGTVARPIIDITGERVAHTFSGTHVAVTYRQGRITITNAEEA